MAKELDLLELTSQIQKEKNTLYNLIRILSRENLEGLSRAGFRGNNLNEVFGKAVRNYITSTSNKIEKMTQQFEHKYPL